MQFVKIHNYDFEGLTASEGDWYVVLVKENYKGQTPLIYVINKVNYEKNKAIRLQEKDKKEVSAQQTATILSEKYSEDVYIENGEIVDNRPKEDLTN